MTGEKVTSVNYGQIGAGSSSLTIDGSVLAPGLYFYTVKAGDEQFTGKMVIRQ
jgi:hypothetical protein